MSDFIKWIDLRDNSEKGRARLKIATIDDGDGRKRQVLFIVGMENSSPRWKRAIDLLGFKESPKAKYLVRAVPQGERILAANFHPVWPRATISMMPKADVILDLKPSVALRAENRPKSPEEESVAIESGSVIRLGRNADGLEVYSSPVGRFIQQENGQRTKETSLLRPEMFLKVGNAVDSLDLCADGFIRAMAMGEVQHSDDLDRFILATHDVAGPYSVEIYDKVATSIDAAMLRFISATYETAQDAYGDASRLYQYLPPYKGKARGDAAMPLPVSVVAQRLLGDMKGKEVLIPNAWDGASFAFLPSGTKISAFRGDKDMSRYSDDLRDSDVTWGDRFDSSFHRDADGLLFNADPVVNEAGARTDYRDALSALRSLASNARAVLVLAADDARSTGQVSAETRKFLDALGRRYDIDVAFEVGAELAGKVGTNHGLRILSLRNRPASSSSKRIAEFPVLHSWDEIKTHVDEEIVTIELREAEAESIDLDSVVVENEFQRPYLAFSKVGEARTMVPKNLQGPLQYALANLEKYNGAVDEFVERELQFGANTLGDRFSPEQIDAIGLSIGRIKTGRGVIIGDETGIGKGRQLAGLATWAQKKGRKVIFVTDRANLFSDFVRDLRDIEEYGRFQPFVMNSDGVIMDVFTNEVLLTGVPGKKMQEILREKTSLEDLNCNLLFSTYSQVSGEDSPKAEWLLAQAEDAFVIVDEAHIAAGSSSNTSQVIVDMVNRAWGVCYSSATWAKSSENLHVYGRAFPEGINVSTLTQTMRTGGEPFSEVFSSMLARDGAFIRREHDLSKIEFTVESDVSRLQRNSELSDQVAAILAAMTYVAGDLNKLIIRLNSDTATALKSARETRRMSGTVQGDYRPREGRIFRSNFGAGSVLYQVMRRFLAVLNADQVADLAIAAINENRKPVIVFDDTGEAFIKRIMNSQRIIGIEGEADSLPEEIRPPTIKDMLLNVMQRLGVIGIQKVSEDDFATEAQLRMPRAENGAEDDGVDLDAVFAGEGVEVGEDRYVGIVDLPGVTAEQQDAYNEGMKKILEMINDLPPMPLNAIDVVQMRLSAMGLRVGEISGRSLRLVPPAEVLNEPIDSPEFDRVPWKIVPRDKRKREVTSTVFAFNSGDLDVMFLNRSAATGISLHASPRFADTRRRELIEMQIPPNPTDRIQLYGRVNRFDQIVTPRITIATTGIFGEVRELMLQNKKLARLSANIRSSRDNAAEIKSVPDLLNVVGEEVARRFLDDNGGIRSRLGITVAEMESPHFPAVQRLTSRIALLLVSQQRQVYDELYDMFADTLAAYEMEGENPLKPKEMDVRATVVDKRIAIGIELEGISSAFDGPVYLKRIEWEEDRKPVDAKGLRRMVKAGRIAMVKDEMASFAESGEASPGAVAGAVAGDDEFVSNLGFPSSYVPGVPSQFPEEVESAEAEQAVEVDAPLPVIDFKLMAAKMERILDAKIRVELAGSEFQDVAHAIAQERDNAVKRAYARKLWVQRYFEKMKPGCIVGIKPKERANMNQMWRDVARFGVVTKVHAPARGKEAMLSRWKFDILMPDDEKPSSYTLSALMEDIFMTTTTLRELEDGQTVQVGMPEIELGTRHIIVGDIFEPVGQGARFRAEALLSKFKSEIFYGKRKRSALVLDGNMYLAAEWAASTKEGSGVVYTDAAGLRHRAVLLNRNVGNQEEMMRYLPVRLWSPKMIAPFLKALTAPATDDRPAIQSNFNEGSFLLSTSFKTAMNVARGSLSSDDKKDPKILLIPGKGVGLLVPKSDVARMLRALRGYQKRLQQREHPDASAYTEQQAAEMKFNQITVSSRAAEGTRRGRRPAGEGPQQQRSAEKVASIIFVDSENPARFDDIVEMISVATGIEVYVPRSSPMGDLAERIQQEHFVSRRNEYEQRMSNYSGESGDSVQDVEFRERSAA